ncbi:MAG: hypothetical protein ACLQLO_15715 [Mycobacterium sp.]
MLDSTIGATSLARIPQRDDVVNVALCANFLPTFSDAMDVDFRIEAIIERASVAQYEVLIHPLALRDGCTLGDVVAAVERGLAVAGSDTALPAHGFAAHQ